MLIRRMLAVEILLGALCVAAFAIAGFAFFNGHRNACTSRDATLDVVHDVLRATEPSELDRQHIPEPRLAQIDQFYLAAYKRIDEARCT